MKIFLRLKHWQLFMLLIGIPLILQFILLEVIFFSKDASPFILIFVIELIFTMSVFFGWFYAMGINLHKKLPATVHLNLKRFKIFLFIPALYILFICIYLFFSFNRNSSTTEIKDIGIFGFIIPAHLFSMFCIFYCLYYNAKSLKAVELQKPVTFSDFAGEFFLIWFYPIGVWIIQPRINKLFDNNESGLKNI